MPCRAMLCRTVPYRAVCASCGVLKTPMNPPFSQYEAEYGEEQGQAGSDAANFDEGGERSDDEAGDPAVDDNSFVLKVRPKQAQ